MLALLFFVYIQLVHRLAALTKGPWNAVLLVVLEWHHLEALCQT